VSAAALWQIAYAPYVSDYSRYMPESTGARPAFWASYWGCTLGSFLPMVLGAIVRSRDATRQSDCGAGTAHQGHCTLGADRVFSGHRSRQCHQPLLRRAVRDDLRTDAVASLVARSAVAHHHGLGAVRIVRWRVRCSAKRSSWSTTSISSCYCCMSSCLDCDQSRGLLPVAARGLRCRLVSSARMAVSTVG